MSNIYDNWERLVRVVRRREEDLELALADSSETSINSSSISSSFTSEPGTPIHSASIAEEIDCERLLPSDYEAIISRSVRPVVYANRKELFLRLCDSPVLLDEGNMSFQLERTTGRKCYMIGASGLKCNTFEVGPWKWISDKDSRFSRVWESKIMAFPFPLDIRSTIETKFLSPKARYEAYLVFKIATNVRGLGSAKGIIKFVKYDRDHEAEERADTVLLQPVKSKNGKIAVRRSDGWMEVQLGTFYNDLGEDGPVEARLLDDGQLVMTSGLIVEGIEFRPTESTETQFTSKKNVRNLRKGIFSNLRISG